MVQLKKKLGRRSVFESRSPGVLKDHPVSAEIYGDCIDDAFVERVRSVGRILEPIRILPNNVIISGHRRKEAAMRLDLKAVPVVVEHGLEELDVIDEIIRSNDQRDKTIEQRGREWKKLTEVEEKRSEVRRLAGLQIGQKPREIPVGVKKPTREAKEGRAKDIAAEKVGLSRSTAEKLAEVVEHIDALEAKGKDEEAEALRDTLETKSVAAAHRQARPKPKAKSRTGVPGTDPGMVDREINTCVGKLVRAVDSRAKACGGRGQHHKECEAALKGFLKAWESWKKDKGAR